MKKISLIFVCVLCLLALCLTGCKNKTDADDPALAEFGNKMAQSDVTTASAKVTYTIPVEGQEEPLVMTATFKAYDSVSDESNTLSVPYFVPVTTDGSEVVLPDNTTDELQLSEKAAKSIASVKLGDLTFSSGYFEGGDYTLDNTGFSATVTDLSAFFGIDVAIEKADVSITVKGNGLVGKMLVSYTTELGNAVSITITYGY